MTKHHHSPQGDRGGGDFLPAAGHHASLPFYTLIGRLLGLEKAHRTLVSQAGLVDGLQVLEIGCGPGHLTVRAKRTQPGAELVGIDPDPQALTIAAKKAKGLNGIRFDQGYAQQLPYPDASFDRVLSAFMFHHLDYDTKLAAAAEVGRVLRPGGSLHLVDFVWDGRGLHGFLARNVLTSAHLQDNTDAGIPRLLAAAGLQCTEISSHRSHAAGLVTFYRATHPEKGMS